MCNSSSNRITVTLAFHVEFVTAFILSQGPQGEPGPPGQQGIPGTQVSESVIHQEHPLQQRRQGLGARETSVMLCGLIILCDLVGSDVVKCDIIRRDVVERIFIV